MKDLGELEFCSGIQVIRDQANKMISFSQAEYITKILQRFRMEELKPLRTPFDINVQLTKGQVPIIQTRKLLK
jgi:ATP-binding cassette subfamily B (MDR/TAP) protein 1